MNRFKVLFAYLLFASMVVCQSVAAKAFEGDVRTMQCPEGAKPVRALQATDGEVYVLADSDNGPVCFHSADYGVSFSNPIRLVDEASIQPGLEFHVWDAAIGHSGKLFVALGTNAWKLKLPKDQWGYFLATIDREKLQLLSLHNINHRPSEGFSLAVNQAGDVSACWLADKLYVQVSRDKGLSFGEPIEIGPSINPCNCCTTVCVFLPTGNLAILYREETNNKRDMYLAELDLQTSKASKKAVSKTPWVLDTCPMTYYSLVSTSSGLTAAWPTQRTVYLAKLDKAGRLQSPGEVQTIGLAGMRTGLLTLQNSKDETLVVWNSDNQIGWQLVGKAMQPTSSTGSVQTTGKGVAGFLDADGEFVLLY